MRKIILVCLLTIPMLTTAQENSPMQAPIMFFDIAGPANAGLKEFYSELFGWDPAADGNLQIAVTPPLFGTFRVEEVPETLIYIGVRNIATKLDEIVTKGGTVDFPRLVVPGVVILGMFRDPAGNRIGLVEINNEGTAVVPPTTAP